MEGKRGALRARIRRIHDMVLGLPGHSGGGAADGVAARIKRAKATALNDIAMELNRQEIRDIQSRANQGGAQLCRSLATMHTHGVLTCRTATHLVYCRAPYMFVRAALSFRDHRRRMRLRCAARAATARAACRYVAVSAHACTSVRPVRCQA